MKLRLSRPGARFLVYGLIGWAVDSVFVFARTGRRRPSSLLNVPVYGLAQPLFEPAHDRLRQRPAAIRAALYGAGILGVEYASGRLLRRFVGYVPWNYGRARFGIDGLVRLDYLPLWALYGLGLERLHDLLAPRVDLIPESALFRHVPARSKTLHGPPIPRTAADPVSDTESSETRMAPQQVSDTALTR